MDSAGNVVAVNTFGANGLLTRRSGAQSSFYTFDQQGSVSQVQDASGNVTSTVLYDAYGSRLSANDSTPFGFGGQAGYYTDPETGLLLLTHRYYDPEEGRFLNRDPIGYAGGMNLYGYCGGNPVNRLDPSGLESEFEESGGIDLGAWQRQINPVNALWAGFTSAGNAQRNADLAQMGASDYANKKPIGTEALKYGAFTTAGMVLDVYGLGQVGGLTDDLLEIAGRRIWHYKDVYQASWGTVVDGSIEDVHHLIPQQFRELFKNIKGLCIDDPQWLRHLPKKVHRGVTRWWEDWAAAHPDASISEIMDAVAETIERWGMYGPH